MIICEHELAVLTTDLPEEGLQKDDIGTVVMVHAGGRGFEVEFTTLSGDTIAVVTIPAESLRPVALNEIAHVRRVA